MPEKHPKRSETSVPGAHIDWGQLYLQDVVFKNIYFY